MSTNSLSYSKPRNFKPTKINDFTVSVSHIFCMMPKHVLIYGHLFVDRLDKFSNYPGNKWQNLCLDGTEIQVSCYGVPGGTLNPGPKSIQRHSDIVLSTCPDAIFLQIGGNDLSDPLVNPHTLAVNIMSFAHYLITVFNVNHVIIGQLLFRFSRRCPNDYNERVISVNDRLPSWQSPIKCPRFRS